MDDVKTPSREERKSALSGLGTSRKRVEDARFTQGKGNYVDDIKLKGMLFGDFVRSPVAHARVKNIDTSAALALPGVHAVLTAADLEPLGLHWMPTLAGDKQMVLADGKVDQAEIDWQAASPIAQKYEVDKNRAIDANVLKMCANGGEPITCLLYTSPSPRDS